MPHFPEYFESQPALNRMVTQAYRRMAAERSGFAGDFTLARLAKTPLFSPSLWGTRASAQLARLPASGAAVAQW